MAESIERPWIAGLSAAVLLAGCVAGWWTGDAWAAEPGAAEPSFASAVAESPSPDRFPPRDARPARGASSSRARISRESARGIESVSTTGTHGKPSTRGRITTSVGLSYSRGEDASGIESDVLYAPLSLKYERRRWTAKLTVPYITVDESRAAPGRRRSTARGLGDSVASVSYRFLPWVESPTALELTAKVKLPTADEDAGLGTGELDYTAQAQISRRFERWTPYLMLGFRWRGQPSGSELGDQRLAGAGFTYRWSDRFSAGFSYDFREASRRGADDVHELVPNASFRLSRSLRLGSYCVIGLSDASPDRNLGLSLSYSFD